MWKMDPAQPRDHGLFGQSLPKRKRPLPAVHQRKGSFNKVAKPFDGLHYFFRKGVIRSIGTGKMVVEFFSVATSVKV